MHATALAALAAVAFIHSTRAQLKLAQNYTGATFFDAWTFYNGIDVNTTGNVLYQTREQAMQEQLTFVNSAGNVIIKVDNTTDGTQDPTFGRPSVKILSNATVTPGDLVLMDAVHMPFGCSVWPAFWMQGPNWPNDGEIDIVENVNLQTNNRYTLHTLDGCTHPPASANVAETGTVISTDCFNATNGDEGCIVQDPSTNSYGAGFAASGGGVFAMLWDDTGIKIWFFARGSIPSDLPTASPNPSGWPTPTAFFPSSACDTTQFFSPQTLIFDTTICGNFAGAPNIFNSGGCSGVCTDLVGVPSNYNDAYFELSYVRVFTNGSVTSSSSSSSAGASPTAGSGSPDGSGSAGGNSGAPHATMTSLLAVVAAVALPIVGALATIAL